MALNELSQSMANELNKLKIPLDIISLERDVNPLLVRDVLSTGLPNLDHILCRSEDGRWGLPVGKIVSIKAKPQVGKTSFLLSVAKQAYLRGGVVHIIESEHALDMKYARKISPIDKFFISQPEILEDAFKIIERAIEVCLKARKKTGTNAPFVIIFDSFSGFTTEGEVSGDFSTGGKALGEHARIASMACRKLTGPIARAKVIFLLSHQTKSKIGVYWGNPDTNIGGDAFNFHDSICLNLNRNASIKSNAGGIIGHYGTFRTSKNKLYPPFLNVKFKIINGRGFSKTFSIFESLQTSGIVKKAGAWYHFKEDKNLKWQGADEFSNFIKTHKKAKKIVRDFFQI